MPLASLIKAIEWDQGIERIRLGSLEPSIITEEFVGHISDRRVLSAFSFIIAK